MHVLSLPPAFVLSQDQTLKLTCPFARPDPKAPDARQDSSRFPTQTRKKVHGTSEIRVRVRVPSGIQPEAGARTPPPAHPFHSTNDVKQPGIETVGLAPARPRPGFPDPSAPHSSGSTRRDGETPKPTASFSCGAMCATCSERPFWRCPRRRTRRIRRRRRCIYAAAEGLSIPDFNRSEIFRPRSTGPFLGPFQGRTPPG